MAAAGGGAPAPIFEQWGKYRVNVAPGGLLGTGLTARVYLAEHGGAPYALKRYASLEGLGAEDQAAIQAAATAELALWVQLRHPHIVRAIEEVGGAGPGICLALAYAPGASAKARMRAPGAGVGLLPLDVIAWVARDIAQALAHLHGDPLGCGPLVHRDIKPGNIVFTAEGEAQLTDFGAAALMHVIKQKSRISKVGTVAFMAPEMHAGAAASPKSDVWMYGATLLCLLTGEELADDLRVTQAFNNLAKPWTLEDHVHCRLQGLNEDEELVPLEGLGLSEGERGVWEAAPAELKDLIQGCLQKRAKDRLSAEQVLAHPFVATVVARYSPRRPTPQLPWLPQWPFPAPQCTKACGRAATLEDGLCDPCRVPPPPPPPPQQCSKGCGRTATQDDGLCDHCRAPPPPPPPPPQQCSKACGRLATREDGLCDPCRATSLVYPGWTGGQLTGHCVAQLKHGGDVSGLAVVGEKLLSGGFSDEHLRVWDLRTGQNVATMAGKVYRIAALPGGRFATAAGGPTAAVWDASTATRICELQGHTDDICCVVSVPGDLVATGSLDKTVRIWRAATGAHVATLEGHTSCVNALAMLPDGRLASGSWDKTVRLWDLATRTCTAELPHTHSIDSVQALAALEGGCLATATLNNKINLWNTTNGVHEGLLEGHSCLFVFSLAALPQGLLASGSADKTVRVWNVAARTCVAVLQGHTGAVCGLVALPDGRLASGSQNKDDVIRVWELRP